MGACRELCTIGLAVTIEVGGWIENQNGNRVVSITSSDSRSIDQLDPGERFAIEDFQLVLRVWIVSGLAPCGAIEDAVEILWQNPRHAGKKLAGQRPRIVDHHIVEIDANPEAMGHANYAEQVGLGAIFGAKGAALIAVAEVEAHERIEADGVSPGANFERRWQPERIVKPANRLQNWWSPQNRGFTTISLPSSPQTQLENELVAPVSPTISCADERSGQ